MSDTNISIKHILGSGVPFGAISVSQGVQFSADISDKKEYKLVIYDAKQRLIDHVNMLDYKVSSAVASCIIIGLPNEFSYAYEINGIIQEDPFIMASCSTRRYKDYNASLDKGKLYNSDFDWEDDKPLNLEYRDVVAYQMHVRGFTAHTTSKVKNRGKFLGVVEKIPYLTDLGINQIVLMPAYEFVEYDIHEQQSVSYIDYTAELDKNDNKPVVNYWGFKTGMYYMPKTAYATEDAVSEFKMMVKCLHKAGIEVMMRFYFPDTVNKSYITDILRFWNREYHVDGFFVMGNNVPIDIISSDLYLRDTKIYVSYLDVDATIPKDYTVNANLAIAGNDFSICAKKYLKSDENMLHDFLYRARRNPTDIHVINYITDYAGFTLNDLVSYDYKHNEGNGEDNKDGENFNYSWNCGYEGYTKKKSVISLRKRQIKNALAFLLLAQGTPMLLAGDEFLNTQNGNNNPYCQDNEIGWVVWKNNNIAKEIYEYTKGLIALRKSHPILHPKTEFRIMDYASCGFPDLSYHGEEAWAPRFDNHLRHIGMMLCGKYAFIDRRTEDDFFYIGYNMHWENHTFALPKLPKELMWEVIICTSDEAGKEKKTSCDAEGYVTVSDRTVVVLKSTKKQDDETMIQEPANIMKDRKEDEI